MEDLICKPGRIAIILGTAAFITAMPFHIELGGTDGIVTMKASQALAKSGDDDSDKGGDDDKGGSGGSSRDDGNDDDDNSGHDNSGHDNSGDGDSGDDSSGDDSSSDGSSSGSGGTTGGTTGDTVGDTVGGSADSADGVIVSNIEVSSSGVEVRYSDGTREEIDNGRYEREDAAGRMVEQRPATQADIDRLMSLN